MATTSNRSMPDAGVIPVLGYADVAVAVEWLVRAFGFRVRLRIGDHRIQMLVGDGAFVVSQGTVATPDSTMVRVDDADAHCAHAEAAGARIVARPQSQPYGERQYTALDLAGRSWTFSQTERDVDPADWGGQLA